MIIGTDVSFYQDDNTTSRKIDFAQMRSAGAKFAIIRIGQNTWPDPDFADYWRDAKAAGIPRGSYFFYDSRVSPRAQADLAISALKSDRGELPLFADYEENYGGQYGGYLHFKDFLSYLEQGLPGKEIGIYTGYYFWTGRVPAPQRDYFRKYPLWIAAYETSAPLIPPPWSGYLFWQFTSKGNGGVYGVESGNIDLNYFDGDENQLKLRFGIGGSVPTDPPPPIDDEILPPTKTGTVIVSSLYIRSGPGTSYDPPIGGLYYGDRVYGNLVGDWMRISRVVRANGAEEVIDAYCSAKSTYVNVTDYYPAFEDVVTYPFEGVQKIVAQRDGVRFQVVTIKKEAIEKATYVVKCGLVEDVQGDIVWNMTGFYSCSQPNQLLKIDGTVIGLQKNTEPFLYWGSNKEAIFDHRAGTVRNISTAASIKRYLVQNGVKNPTPSSAWDEIHSWQLLGAGKNGETIIITMDAPGSNLHFAASLMLEFGVVTGGDSDSGSTGQIKIGSDIKRCTPEIRAAANFGVITIKSVGQEPPDSNGDSAVITGTVKSTATPYVNLRNAPGGSVVGKVYPGEAIKAHQLLNGWLQVYEPVRSNKPDKQWADASFFDYAVVQDPDEEPTDPPITPTPSVEITEVRGKTNGEPWTWTPQ